MIRTFSIGEHVTWKTAEGQVGGTIVAVHTEGVRYQGHMRNASVDDPQYSIQGDDSDALVMHKGSALTAGPTHN